MIDKWPEEFIDIIQPLMSEWSITNIQVQREFKSGKSGARVLLVDIDESRHHRGQAIMKLEKMGPWNQDINSEISKYAQAWAKAPAYAEQHLPKLLDSFQHNGKCAFLCSLAGGTFNNIRTFDGGDSGTVLRSALDVSRGLLNNWNEDYFVSAEPLMPRLALSKWLGYRLDPNEGRIYKFLQEECGLNPLDPAFLHDAGWLPNPYAYARLDELWPADLKVKLARGRLHGDLHGDNILLKILVNEDCPYYLIDLAMYEEESFLFYDHAYFELSTLLNKIGESNIQRWASIWQSSTKFGVLDVPSRVDSLSDVGLVEFMQQTRLGINEWILKNEANRRDHMEGQVLLARVAAGLNFVNKSVDEHRRRLALFHASVHLMSFFKLFSIDWQKKGESIRLPASAAQPATSEWRDVFSACDNFERNNKYILIAGPDVRKASEEALSAFGRVPWAIVYDHDSESKYGGLLNQVSSTGSAIHALRETYFDQLRNVNFDQATSWFMASGSIDRPETKSDSYLAWSRKYLAPIRDLCKSVKRRYSGWAFKVLILADGLKPEILDAMIRALDEVLEDDAAYVIVGSTGTASSTYIDDFELASAINCSVADLGYGIREIFVQAEPEKVRLPARLDQEPPFIYLNKDEIDKLREDVEIVHGGLAFLREENRDRGYDFWRGNPITWPEIDMHADLDRLITPDLTLSISQGLERVHMRPIYTTILFHSPGSGATTVARRIAWDLKDKFPTILLHNYSNQTAGLIDYVFQKSGLPILVVLEAATVTRLDFDTLCRDLKGRNTRAALLYLVRKVKLPASSAGNSRLADPMAETEARRFAEAYKKIAESRGLALDMLLENDMVPYRSPFFFGLTAFEENFVGVPEYVKSHVSGVGSDEARMILKFLALVTAYSQAKLSEAIVKSMLGFNVVKGLRLNQVLGEGASKLILHRDQALRVSHALIAQEILHQLLTDEAQPDALWKNQLSDFCCKIIDCLADTMPDDSDEVIELLSQLFISRDNWELNQRSFSDLVLDMSSNAGQHNVLQKLVDRFPSEAHFWHHLARHHMYRMHTKYEIAAECMERAIEHEPNNSVHHHGLGQIYRSEIRQRMQQLLKDRRSDKEILQEISELCLQAQACFKKARELDRESEYGLITPIQMIKEIINALFLASDAGNLAQFLARGDNVGTWCRNELAGAEVLLRQVKTLQGDNLSFHTKKCDAEVMAFYGGFDLLVNGLLGLLEEPGIYAPDVRRTIADSYYAHRKRQWHAMKARDLERVHQILTENLDDEPGNTRDLWMWFQAYRRLSNFNIMEAIDKLKGWSLVQDSLEANYYLYVLYFILWRQKFIPKPDVVIEHIAKCRSLVTSLNRTFSPEWLAKDPKWCPLAERGELGEWKGFWQNPAPLAEVKGIIKQADRPPSGLITVSSGLDAFFVPGTDFISPDVNTNVKFYLGFSYTGLRAWKVAKISDPIRSGI